MENYICKAWTYGTYRNHYKFTKRFVVYLYKWYWLSGERAYLASFAVKNNDYAEFDTMEEVQEYFKLIEDIYSNVKKPVIDGNYYVHKATGKKYERKPYSYDKFENDRDYKYIERYIETDASTQFYWGYMLLDYQKDEIIGMWGERHPDFGKNYKNDLKLKDRLFRKPGEVPIGYKWDDGEYDGWLQFRWGDGKNAIEVEDKINQEKEEKKKQHKPKKRQVNEFETLECDDSIYNEFYEEKYNK